MNYKNRLESLADELKAKGVDKDAIPHIVRNADKKEAVDTKDAIANKIYGKDFDFLSEREKSEVVAVLAHRKITNREATDVYNLPDDDKEWWYFVSGQLSRHGVPDKYMGGVVGTMLQDWKKHGKSTKTKPSEYELSRMAADNKWIRRYISKEGIKLTSRSKGIKSGHTNTKGNFLNNRYGVKGKNDAILDNFSNRKEQHKGCGNYVNEEPIDEQKDMGCDNYEARPMGESYKVRLESLADELKAKGVDKDAIPHIVKNADKKKEATQSELNWIKAYESGETPQQIAKDWNVSIDKVNSFLKKTFGEDMTLGTAGGAVGPAVLVGPPKKRKKEGREALS